jgi:hypothetical protein
LPQDEPSYAIISQQTMKEYYKACVAWFCMSDGREFILTQADNFEAEVDALRNNFSFQNFLQERSQCQARIPIEEIEREIDEELKTSSSA